MILDQSSFILSAAKTTQTFHLQYQFSTSHSTLDTTMSRLFWRIPITGYTCDLHGVPVVWRVTPSHITPGWISQSVVGVKEHSYTKILQFARNHRNGAHS